MPIYTYHCIQCGVTETKMTKIADRDEQDCRCGQPLDRKIDRPGLVWAPTAGGMR